MVDAKQVDSKMQKTIENYIATLGKIRTGRAHTGLLDHITVDYYGAVMPLNQVATVTAGDGQTLVVQAFDGGMVKTIEKVIRESDLGLNPTASGSTIRVPMPPLTEERRKELIKVVKAESEQAKVSLRNIRRDINAETKALLKAKEITEDDDKKSQDTVQKATNKSVTEIDKLTQAKEKELLKV